MCILMACSTQPNAYSFAHQLLNGPFVDAWWIRSVVYNATLDAGWIPTTLAYPSGEVMCPRFHRFMPIPLLLSDSHAGVGFSCTFSWSMQ